MIALLLALAPGPSFVKVDVPSATEISFAISAPLPKLGAKDLQILEVAVAALKDGSEVYTGRTIRDVTDGRGIRCQLLPDAVLVSFDVPKGSFAYGLAMLASFVQQPAFRQESIDKAFAALTARPPTYWSLAMHPLPFDLKSTNHDELVGVFGRIFKPETVTVACVGPVSKENLVDAWSAKTAKWVAAPDPRFPDDTVATPPVASVSGVSTAVLRGTELAFSDTSFSSKLLALYALGSGKASSLFRIARDEHGWSYQQASYLWPTLMGFEPVLYLASRPNTDAAKRVSDLQAELATDVAAWTEDDRVRALGMAEATLLRDVPFGPILLGDHPLQEGQEDKACMSAYWRMKTGTEWDPAKLLESMKGVDLAVLRTAAQDILTHSTLQLLEGK